MKKAVGYLIPFMEEEKQAKYKEMAAQGIEFDEDVRKKLIRIFVCCSE